MENFTVNPDPMQVPFQETFAIWSHWSILLMIHFYRNFRALQSHLGLRRWNLTRTILWWLWPQSGELPNPMLCSGGEKTQFCDRQRSFSFPMGRGTHSGLKKLRTMSVTSGPARIFLHTKKGKIDTIAGICWAIEQFYSHLVLFISWNDMLSDKAEEQNRSWSTFGEFKQTPALSLFYVTFQGTNLENNPVYSPATTSLPSSPDHIGKSPDRSHWLKWRLTPLNSIL